MNPEAVSTFAFAASYVIPAAFMAAVPAHAGTQNVAASHLYVEDARPGHSTFRGQSRRISDGPSGRKTITGREEFKAEASPWPEDSRSFILTQTAPWHQIVSNDILRFEGLSDGWKGPDSTAPTRVAVEEALELAMQIAAELPGIPSPLVGADDEGCFSFYWRDADVMANLSIYGDGTYSFYAQNDLETAEADAETVGMPLPVGLLRVLSSIAQA